MTDTINIIEQQDPEPPIPVPPIPETPHVVAAPNAAVVASSKPPGDMQAAYQEEYDKLSFNKAAWEEEKADSARTETINALPDYVENLYHNGADDATAVESVQLAKQSADEEAQSPLAAHLALVDMHPDPRRTHAEREELALSAYTSDLLASVAAGTNFDGKWGLSDLGYTSLKGIAGVVVNPAQTDLSQIGIHNFPAFVSAFQKRPPQERALMLHDISKELDRVGTSTVKKLSFLTTLTDPFDGTTDASIQLAGDALTASWLGGYIARSASGVYRIAKLGKLQHAAVLNKVAATSEEAAKTLNTTTQTAIDTAVPFNMEVLNPASIPKRLGVAEETAKTELAALTREAEQTQAELRQQMAGLNPLLPKIVADAKASTQAVSEAQAAALSTPHTSVVEKAQTLEDNAAFSMYNTYDRSAGNIVIDATTLGDTSLHIKATVTGKAGQAVPKEVFLGETELGTFDAIRPPKEMRQGRWYDWFTSPQTKFEDITGHNELVQGATQAVLNTQRMHNTINSVFNEVLNPIRRTAGIRKGLVDVEKWRKVKAAIIASDRFGGPGATGIRYRPHELAAGIDTADGVVALTLDEQKVYYKYAAMVDELGVMHNAMTHELMVKDGVKSVQAGNSLANGVPLTPEASAAYIRSAGKEDSIILADGSVGKTSAVTLKDTESVVRLEQEIQVVGEGVFTHMVVDNKWIKELPLQVMPRREMYAPIIRQGTHFVITEYTAGKVNGIHQAVDASAGIYGSKAAPGGATQRTQTLHSSKSDALSELTALNEAIPADQKASKVYVLTEQADAHYSGRMPLVSRGNGVGKGARASHDVTAGAGMNAPDQLDLGPALQRYFGVLSRDMHIAPWRYEHLKSIEREYNALVPPRDGKLWRFGEPMVEGEQFQSIRDKVNYTKAVISSKTPAEAAWEKNVLRIGNFMDAMGGKAGKGVGRSINNLSSSDPVQAYRSATSHLKLGMLNAGQLIVQGANLAQVASIHLPTVLKVLPDYAATRIIMNIQNPIARAKNIEEMVKQGLVSRTFADKMARFDRTNIAQAVNSHVDMAKIANNLPEDFNAFKWGLDKGYVFAREGETFGQVMTWLVADDLAESGKLAAGLKGDDRLRAVAEYQRRLTLNISKANRADFEEARYLKFATQYAGIVTKFSEMWAPKTFVGGTAAFSGKQKFGLFFGQVGYFGMVGTTATAAAATAYCALTGKEYKDLTKEEIDFIEQGSVSVLAPDIALGDRVTLIPDFEDAFFSIGEADADMTAMVLGATESTLKQQYVSFHAVAALFGTTTGSHAFSKDQATLAIRETLRMSSSFSNWEKAYIMYRYGQLQQRSTGDVLLYNPTMNEIIGQALGVPPTRLTAYYHDRVDDKRKGKLEAKFVKALVKDFHEAELYSTVDTDKAKYDQKLADITAKVEAFTGGDHEDTVRLSKSFHRAIREGKRGTTEDAVMKWIRSDSSKAVDSLMEQRKFLEAERVIKDRIVQTRKATEVEK